MGIPGIGTGTITLSGAMTALCGRNGVGKTRLMLATAAFLAASPFATTDHVRRRLAGTTVSLQLHIDGTDYTLEGRPDTGIAALPPGVIIPNVLWLDPQLHCVRLADTLGNLKGLDELLEQVEPREYDANELQEISYIVGRQYTRVVVWETDADALLTPLPYFRVTWQGQEYGAEDMGLGELCAHYLFWSLSRAESDSLLLLEEPEAFLIPESQAALMNYLASIACRRRHTAIVTTHSATVLERFPIEHIRVLRRTDAGFEASAPTSRVSALRPLGLEVPKRAILLTEDNVATSMIKAILANTDVDLLLTCELRACNGRDEIISRVEGWPVPKAVFAAIGVLDGDSPAMATLPALPVVRLPSGDPPEVYLKTLLRLDYGSVAAVIGCDLGRLAGGDAALEGRDHHDWLVALADLCGTTTDGLTRAIITVHARRPEGRGELDSVVAAIKNHL